MNDPNPYAPPEAPLVEPATADSGTYFTVGAPKLAIMSICTFSLYELYWFYRNWHVVKRQRGRDLMPFWRAFFAPLWTFSMTAELRDHARALGLPVNPSPALLGIAYLVLSMCYRLPDPYWIVSMLTFVPVLALERVARAVNASLGEPHPRHARFTGWNWLGIVLGGGVLLLAIAGMLLPPVG